MSVKVFCFKKNICMLVLFPFCKCSCWNMSVLVTVTNVEFENARIFYSFTCTIFWNYNGCIQQIFFCPKTETFKKIYFLIKFGFRKFTLDFHNCPMYFEKVKIFDISSVYNITVIDECRTWRLYNCVLHTGNICVVFEFWRFCGLYLLSQGPNELVL